MLYDENDKCLLVMADGTRAYAVAIYDTIPVAELARETLPLKDNYFLLPVNPECLDDHSMRLLKEGVAVTLADWERGGGRRVFIEKPTSDSLSRSIRRTARRRRTFWERIGLA